MDEQQALQALRNRVDELMQHDHALGRFLHELLDYVSPAKAGTSEAPVKDASTKGESNGN